MKFFIFLCLPISLYASATFDPFEKVYTLDPELYLQNKPSKILKKAQNPIEEKKVLNELECGQSIDRDVFLEKDLIGCQQGIALKVVSDHITIDCNYKMISRFMGKNASDMSGQFAFDLGTTKDVTIQHCRLVGFTESFLTSMAENFHLIWNMSSMTVPKNSFMVEQEYVSEYSYDENGRVIKKGSW